MLPPASLVWQVPHLAITVGSVTGIGSCETEPAAGGRGGGTRFCAARLPASTRHDRELTESKFNRTSLALKEPDHKSDRELAPLSATTGYRERM